MRRNSTEPAKGWRDTSATVIHSASARMVPPHTATVKCIQRSGFKKVSNVFKKVSNVFNNVSNVFNKVSSVFNNMSNVATVKRNQQPVSNIATVRCIQQCQVHSNNASHSCTTMVDRATLIVDSPGAFKT